MTRIATGSLFLVSFSFLSNFRICKDNVKKQETLTLF